MLLLPTALPTIRRLQSSTIRRHLWGLVFRLPYSRASIEASSEYKRVRKLLRLGLIVGNYDGLLSEKEKASLEAVIANASVSIEERMRLRMYLFESMESQGRADGWHSGCGLHLRAFDKPSPADEERDGHGVDSRSLDKETVKLPVSARLMIDIFDPSIGLAQDSDTVFPDLDLRHKALLVELVSRRQWSLDEFEVLVARMRLAPATSVERINEWARVRLGVPLVIISKDCIIVNRARE